jgi:Arm DNA-binding domain
MSAANSRRLTDAIARKALPSARGAAILWDAEVKGFGLRLSPGGGRSFMLDYRAEGRQRRITIGAYPDWAVAAAREAAKAMKREVDLGRDPMSERHAERAAPTVPDLWERYRLEHLPTKAARSQKDETMMWEQIVLPRFGKMKVAAISHEDIDDLHRDITTIRGTPIRANRMVEVLRKARKRFPPSAKLGERAFGACCSSRKAGDRQIEAERAGNCRSDVIFPLEMQRLAKLDEFFLRRKQPDDAA